MKKKLFLILTTLFFLSSIATTAYASATSNDDLNVENITKYNELSSLKTEYAMIYQHFATHELGHALWLADKSSSNMCIMGQDDANAIYYPTASDIAGVNAKW